MSWDENVYYQPEKFGLKVLAEMEFGEPNYSFDTRVLWLHEESGVLYTARDSGCSCPTPFELFDSIEKLERVDFASIESEIKLAEGDKYTRVKPEESSNFLATIKNHSQVV